MLTGIVARGMFVIVKPAALWCAIKLDSDQGQMLAQVFMVGILVISLTGTNAHREFYRRKFENTQKFGRHSVASSYLRYMYQIGQQLSFIFFVLVVFATFWPGQNTTFIWIALAYGLAEKISDEEIRYMQFCLNNNKLLIWALAKVGACFLAVAIAWAAGFPIGIVFPILTLLIVSLLSWRDLKLSILELWRSLSLSLWLALRDAFVAVRRDAGQIAWVFTSMALMNLDKWMLQFVEPKQLAPYMFFAQIAATFLVAQTIFVLAPNRVKLVHSNPTEIRQLSRWSWLFAGSAWAAGLGIIALNDWNVTENLTYFPFLLYGVFVMSAPYLERLYWVVRDIIRISIDAGVAMFLLGSLAIYTWIKGETPDLYFSLIWLLLVLIARVTIIWLIIHHYPPRKVLKN